MPEGDCGKKMKLILEVGVPTDVKGRKEVRKPIAVKQEEPIRQMPDRQHLSGWTPTDSYRTAEKSGIIEQEPIVKPDEEDYSRKHMTLDGGCGNKMKSILGPLPLPDGKEIKEVRKPIAVKQGEPDWQQLFGRTPTDSYRTTEKSEVIKQESTLKAKGEDYSRKHKTPDGDCGNKVKLILEPPLPPYVEAVKEERKPIAVKQEKPIRQLPNWQLPFGRTPTDSYRTAQMSGIITQESTVKAEGEDCSRKHKTPDGDCSNKVKLILEPPLPRYVEEVKEVRKPIAVKQEEPIRQLPDWQHPFGRTPTDSYRTAEMCDTRNAAVGRVTKMPDFQHYIARTPVYRYYTPEEALQLNSPYIQPGISAAQMAYRESAELKAYRFMGTMNIRREEQDYSRNYTAFEDYSGYGRYMAGCSCHGRKKCAHARGAGQCDCKAAGKKCGYNCNCDEWICTNRAW